MTLSLRFRTLAFLGLVLCAARSASAGSATWNPGPGAGVWNTPTSWSPATVPNGPNDIATFLTGNTTDKSVAVAANIEVNTVDFQQAATTFTIKPNAGVTLTLSGAGVVKNFGWQDVGLPSSDNASLPSPIVQFKNGASAGSKNTYYYTDNAVGQVGGGRILFFDHATAGEADIRLDGGYNSTSAPSRLEFHNSSDAGSATFYCNNGGVAGAPGAVIEFNDSSSAMAALFHVNAGQTGGSGSVHFNGGTAGDAIFNIGGSVVFSPASSAGNATLNAYGAQSLIVLSGDGGTSKITLGGQLDVSGHASASPVTIGSLAGGGEVFLGNVSLRIGADNLSTTYSGIIQDNNRTGTGAAGGSLTKTGTGTLTLSGANTYTGGTIVEAGKLLIANPSGSGTGPGPVTVKSAGATLGGTGFIAGAVTANSGAVLSGGDAGNSTGALTIASDLTLMPGSVVQLGLSSGGNHSTLHRAGGTWTFAANQTFTFVNGGVQPGVYDNLITGLAGDPGNTSSWTISNPEISGSFSYDGAGNIDLVIGSAASPTPSPTPSPGATPAATPTPTSTPIPGLVGNVSTRLPVGTNDDALIEGFIVQGPPGTTKKVMVRALGPSLTGFGVTDALGNPTLEIHDSSNAIVATNDDWKQTQAGGLVTGDQSTEISQSGLAPSNESESAIIANLAPGGYTAVVRGINNTSGTGVVDAYDLTGPAPARLANIATRGLVQPGDGLMIAGFIVQDSPVRVVVTALGPSLQGFGVNNALPDTTLELHDGNGKLLLANDDWPSDQKQELEGTGLQPSNNLEAALVSTIQPGQYTAQVRGKNGASGIGVVQVFFLQN